MKALRTHLPTSLVFRLLPVVAVALLGLLALQPSPVGAVGTVAKVCSQTSPNLYTCTLTISPTIDTDPGSWLVQMDTASTGTFASTPVVSASTTGCSTLPGVASPGSFISGPAGTADYDVVIGSGGCDSSATVVITETIAVTASGQVCQKVWVVASSPFETACATVTYTAPGSGPFTGSIAPSGASLVVFGGGTVMDLGDAATAAGIRSVWLTTGGMLVGYVPGAPSFVNAGFTMAFPNGVPAGPVILVASAS